MEFFRQFTDGVEGTPRHHFYKKPKASGGYRIIGKPNKAMLEVQGRFLKFIREIAPNCPSAAARKGGLGSVRNARRHGNKNHVFQLDFFNAYGNTDGERLAKILSDHILTCFPESADLFLYEETLTFLRKYTLDRNDGLIQGSRVSPALLDWYCEVTVDGPIRDYMNWITSFVPWSYTRYLDDLVISSYYRLTRGQRSEIRRIIQRAGFLENHWKTRVAKISKNGPVIVTGVSVHRDGQTRLSRRKVKTLERMLHSELHDGPNSGLSPEIIDGKLRYMLDVTRGVQRLNALESRTLKLFITWANQNEKKHSASWASKVLERKGAK